MKIESMESVLTIRGGYLHRLTFRLSDPRRSRRGPFESAAKSKEANIDRVRA